MFSLVAILRAYIELNRFGRLGRQLRGNVDPPLSQSSLEVAETSRHYSLRKNLVLGSANSEFDVAVLDSDSFEAQAGQSRRSLGL
jgi:hypothetical protein